MVNIKLSSLHPTLQAKYLKLEKLAWDRFKIRIKITQGLRTDLEQYAYWTKGRLSLAEVNKAMKKAKLPAITESENRIVTKCKSSETTLHGYGLAFDIVLVLPDGKTITYKDDADTNTDGLPDWNQVGSLADEVGLEWGGNFTSIMDKPHYQDRMGWTIPGLIAAKIPPGQTYIGLPYNAVTTSGPRITK